MYQLKEPMSAENVTYYLSKFKCQRCKPSCCVKVNKIALKPNEDKTLAAALGIPLNRFKRYYTFTEDGNRFMTAPCPFYKDKCTIYKDRPQVCRQYPFNRSHNGCITVNHNCPAGVLVGEKYGVKV